MKTKTLTQIIYELEQSVKNIDRIKKLPDYKPLKKYANL